VDQLQATVKRELYRSGRTLKRRRFVWSITDKQQTTTLKTEPCAFQVCADIFNLNYLEKV
jgi:hypothetical protein